LRNREVDPGQEADRTSGETPTASVEDMNSEACEERGRKGRSVPRQKGNAVLSRPESQNPRKKTSKKKNYCGQWKPDVPGTG